ncbi:MAG: sensor histidine kinase [Eubacteriales bacterium]|nr:sensor histidine kinase [Eubacteriales bacterium]
MDQTLSDILALSGEAALLVRQGKIVFLNPGARRILGECTGVSAAERLGLDPAQTPARAYLVDLRIDEQPYILRVNRVSEGRLVFLQRQADTPVLLNDAFLYSLRSNLMTLGLAADRLRPAAEDQDGQEMLGDLTALTAAYYKLMRLSDNASLVRDHFEHRASATLMELDMSLLCHAVLDAAEDCFPDRAFVREIPAGIRLTADPRLVRQLLFNLLSNSLIHAEASILRVSLSETERQVVLALGDNGCGIPAEELPTVFERYRYGLELSGKGAGVGFGLTAVRAVTQLHGGTLLLESRPDQGTEIRASFSKRLRSDRLGGGDALCSMRELLLGLADCLPLRFFEARYLD